MNTKTRTRKRVQVSSGVMLLILAAPLAVGISGCGNKDSITAAKDGQKFPPAKPPADYIAERERLRRNAPPPGAAANPQPPGTAR